VAQRWNTHLGESAALSCGKDWVVCALCPKVQQCLFTAKVIVAHNQNCHSKKRASAVEKTKMEEEERKKIREEKVITSNKDPAEDNVGEQSTPVQELKWIEVRMSPLNENKEDSLLFANGSVVTQKNLLAAIFDKSDSYFHDEFSSEKNLVVISVTKSVPTTSLQI
jgi:hypothetical protein